MEDTDLIKRCQNGDKAAFQQLISKYHPIIFKFLIKITENEQLSEDLTQEVFIKMIRNIEKFNVNGEAKFSTYMITVSKNSYIDYLRKQKRGIQVYPIEEASSLQDVSSNFEETVVDRIYSNDVIKRVETLTDEQKIAIKLKYIEGLTLKEIGSLLDLEPKTVKSRIHNGITKVKKMLERSE